MASVPSIPEEACILELQDQGPSPREDRPYTRKAGRAAREAIRDISRGPYARKEPLAQDRVEARRQRALDRHFDRAQRQHTIVAQVHRPDISGSPRERPPQTDVLEDQNSGDISPDHYQDGSRSPSPSIGGGTDLFDCEDSEGESLATQAPSTSQVHCPRVPSSQARPAEDTGPSLSAEMREVITSAISLGIVQALKERDSASGRSPRRGSRAPRATSPQPSVATADSVSEVDDLADPDLSEDEGRAADKPAFTGLFKPALFKSILYKAKVITHMESIPPPPQDPVPDQAPVDPDDPSGGLFEDEAQPQEQIPSPKLFKSVVQRQWVQPASSTSPGVNDKRFYSGDSSMEELLKLPEVDAPVAAMTSNSILPPDLLEGLKAEDKRAERSCHKTHQAAAWAIRASTSASFFSRASIAWLRQLLRRLPQGDPRLRQDVNKIMAAVEFTADASLNAAKFASRAMASNVTSRRLLWLRHWNADMRSKWKLASAPFKGGKLFGEALDSVLIENKDKKKVMPSVSRKPDRRPPAFRKQSYRTSDNHAQSSSSSSFPRPYSQGADRPQERQPFRDRFRQQPYNRRPFRGGQTNRPFRRNK